MKTACHVRWILLLILLIAHPGLTPRALAQAPYNFGTALQYNTTNSAYVKLAAGPVLGRAFTEEAWIFVPSGIDTAYHGIFGNDDSGSIPGRSPSLWVVNQTALSGGFGDGSVWNVWQTANGVITTNFWNHVAVTYNGTNYLVYVNGQQVYSDAVNATPLATPVIYVGRVDNYFPGAIDEVRLWNVVRTPAQILASRNTPLVGNETGLVAYYRFDEGSGTVTSNSATATGTAYNGTLVNSPAWVGGPMVVTTNTDSGPGSLRQIMTQVPVGSTLSFLTSLSGQVITLTNGAITLANNLTIDASDLPAGIQLNGNHASNCLIVNSGVNAVLNSLTITNGYNASNGGFDSGFGGGIYSAGTLTLNRCYLVNNQSTYSGGGLWSGYGALTMSNTTVAGNLCGSDGSGIMIQDGSTVINGCTFSGNTGSVGAAVAVNIISGNYQLTMLNSTLSGNTGNEYFGSALGIQCYPNESVVVGLTNCTIVSNVVDQATQPGAIYLEPDAGTIPLTLVNTIVAGNTVAGVPSDITGTATTNSAFNLIGAGGGLTNGVKGNLVGINNPGLAALGDYGGSTQTMPPLAGSLAIDAGTNSVTSFLATDQRGYARRSGTRVDIGAVELQYATQAPVLKAPLASATGSGQFQLDFTNAPGASFSVYAGTNVTEPFAQWLNIGPVFESPAGSGQFQFTDPQPATNRERFYRIHSP